MTSSALLLEKMLSDIDVIKDSLKGLYASVEAVEKTADELHHMGRLNRAESGFSLSTMQSEIGEWSRANFPKSDLRDKVLGMQEELGELSHVILKARQGIRGHSFSSPKTMHDIGDAIADLIIFTLDASEHLGVNAEEVLVKTWTTVKQRDWRAFPVTGRDLVSVPSDGEITLEESEIA